MTKVNLNAGYLIGILLLVHSMKKVKQEDVSKLFQTASQRLRPPSMAQSSQSYTTPLIRQFGLHIRASSRTHSSGHRECYDHQSYPTTNRANCSSTRSVRRVLPECPFDALDADDCARVQHADVEHSPHYSRRWKRRCSSRTTARSTASLPSLCNVRWFVN